MPVVQLVRRHNNKLTSISMMLTSLEDKILAAFCYQADMHIKMIMAMESKLMVMSFNELDAIVLALKEPNVFHKNTRLKKGYADYNITILEGLVKK
ncbi:protein of unknown function [Vibrio tapetis subsp. tapetis]|uniref:Uncharacterized protein n=1 Tax=Vibrio tapetis subsp. tapetis TaxID=1671868 RepID=A0A2N8ZHD3_9VIBR|nr:protein of unknown function [Vibrio tapetis subsp. tapetis]